MPPLMQLPGYRMDNALLNFSGLNEGIDAYQQGREKVRVHENNALIGSKLASKDYDGAAAAAGQGGDIQTALNVTKFKGDLDDRALKQRHAKADEIGRMAQAALEIKDPAQRQRIHDMIIAKHPDGANLDPMFRTPDGLRMIASQAANYKTELEQQIERAKLGQIQAATRASDRGDQPEIVRQLRAAGIDPKGQEGQGIIRNAIKGGDPMSQMIAERLRGMNGPQSSVQPNAAPVPQGGGIKPMGLEEGAPQSSQNALYGGQDGPSDGNIVRVQQPGQNALAQPAQPSEPMVTNPLGTMRKSDADLFAFGLAMQGKGDAGKMLSNVDTMGKEAQNQNDKAALNSIEQSSRLDSIANKFKPEYQTIDFKVKNFGTSALDSFGPTRKMVNPADRQKLAEFTQYKQDSYNNLSAYIKEITGAAMGVQEEGRIRQGMPDPEKDSPTEFEAKMKGAIATAKLALARHSYLKKNGYDAGSIAAMAKSDKLGTLHSLDNMESIIDQSLSKEKARLQQQNPNIDKKVLDNQLKMFQRREFGI